MDELRPQEEMNSVAQPAAGETAPQAADDIPVQQTQTADETPAQQTQATDEAPVQQTREANESPAQAQASQEPVIPQPRPQQPAQGAAYAQPQPRYSYTPYGAAYPPHNAGYAPSAQPYHQPPAAYPVGDHRQYADPPYRQAPNTAQPYGRAGVGYPAPTAQPVAQPTAQPAGQPVAQPYQYPAQPAAIPQQPADAANPYTAAEPAGAFESPHDPYPVEKPRASAGTKAYLIVLTAVMLAMVIGFIYYISTVADKDKGGGSDFGSDRSGQNLYEDIFNGDDGNIDIIGNNGKEYEEEITLVEDVGDTQKRSDDNPDSVGTPDKNAKGIELKALPKDKDNAKYDAQSAYDAVSDSVVTVELFDGEITENINDIKGVGTGTIISADGYIVTNAHVIGNSRKYLVKIVLSSGKSYQAKIIGYDTWTDLAVIKIDAKDLNPIVFGDSSLIEIGQDVITIGSPGGEKFQNSLTKGIVSAVGRELSINKYVRYIQSDAAISPGNSGGPLCNIYGQVIGINTAKTVATYYEAMTFSIPSDTVQDIVNDLIRYGYVNGRTRIGFSGTETGSEDAYSFSAVSGIIINEIDPNGALAGTDIKAGDVITAVDGVEVSTFQDIYAILNEHKPGDKIKLTVYREDG